MIDDLESLLPEPQPRADFWSWGTVTQVSPLRVRLDGESNALGVTPESLVMLPVVGDRVWCQIAGHRIIVHGRKTVASEAYPVGAIYMSVNNTNPATLFGGTWVAWGAGRVPVGVSSSDSDFNAPENTGGAKTHTLTTSEMPAHNHSGTAQSAGSHSHDLGQLGFMRNNSSASGSTLSNSPAYHYYSPVTSTNSAGAHTHTLSINNNGGGGAHNNLQPYITCYMWKRTA